MFDEAKYEGVRTLHPECEKRRHQWAIMRDCIEGGDKIKAEGEKYLPAPSSAHEQMDVYEKKRYENFKLRADYTNYVAQILDCLHGMAENRPAKIEVPVELKEKGILDNIDYQGNSADQFFSDCLYDVLQTGFGGILVDVPKVDPNTSVLKAEKDNVRPYLSYYNAESIINWRYALVNGVKKLVLVVLKEEVDNPTSIFSHRKQEVYRVLRLDNGKYIQEIYTFGKGKDNKEIEVKSKPLPVTVNGNDLDYIPFVMLPFNKPIKPLLYDIALLNIGHYQKSADYNNGVHLTTLPTGWTTGWSQENDPNTKEPKPIYLGADTFIQIPDEKAKIGNLTFAGEGLVHSEQALNRVECQIITLASHIISSEKKTAENKDALSIHRQGEDAKLATYIRYMSQRYSNTIKIICDWLGLECESNCVELNTDFSVMTFDANAVNSIANIFSQGKLPLRSLYYMLRQGGYLEPDLTYDGFVYLLDLESTSLAPTEVEEAYKKFKKTGKKVQYEKTDWYSPETFYAKVNETVNEKATKEPEEDK